MQGGFVIGLLYHWNTFNFAALLQPMMVYMFKTFAYLGFICYSFKLGVETNIGALLKNIDKQTTIICYLGFFASIAFSYVGLKILNITSNDGIRRIILLNAQSFFVVTCNHVNEIGIGNSELGRLACTVSLILDIFGMFLNTLVDNVIFPVIEGNFLHPIMVIGTYILMLIVCRPLVIHIISYTPEGKRVKESHFFAIFLIVLLLAFLSLQMQHFFAVFLFGFFLPTEPLSTILYEKLDAITSSVLFPIFCAVHGFRADLNSLHIKSFVLETLLIMGASGKFLATLISSMCFGVHLKTAFCLSIIMASGGFINLIKIGQYQQVGVSYLFRLYISLDLVLMHPFS